MFQAFIQILRKEFFSFFKTGLAYFVIGGYLLLSMLTTFYLGAFFNVDNSRLFSFFYFQSDIFTLLIPALTMRLWAEENKSGTAEFLLTQPLSYGSIILGKFCAAWIFCGLLLVLSMLFWGYISSFYPLDNLNIFSAYLGCLLVSGAICAIGCAVSAFCKSPIVAYILALLCGWAIIIAKPDYIIYHLLSPENSAAELTLALNFGKHYADFISGQPGLDNLFYFVLLIVFPLAINYLILADKKRMPAFCGLIFISMAFIFLNLGGSLLFAPIKADLTEDSRFSLSKPAQKIASELKSPLYAKLYLSASLGAENTAQAQYAQYVLRMLRKFQAASNGNLKLQIINPQPYSEAAKSAEKVGIKAFTSVSGEKLYFGLEIINKAGEHLVIPYFDSNRSNLLEQEISRALATLSLEQSYKISVIAPEFQQFIQKSNFGRLLQQDYQLQELSPLIAEVPQDTKVLILLLTSPMTKGLAYAVDQYLLRGGNILLLVDNDAQIQTRRQGYPNLQMPQINALLQEAGIFLIPEQLVGSQDSAVSTMINGEMKTYPLWLTTSSKHFNLKHLVTSDLQKISFKTAGGLVTASSTEYKVTPLISLKQNTFSQKAETAKLSSLEDTSNLVHYPEQLFVLAALSEGSFNSSFSKGYYEGLQVSDKFMPFLAASIAPGRLAVISDIDILDDALWSSGTKSDASEIIPLTDNGLFMQRLVDYLAGRTDILALPRRQIDLNNITPKEILTQKIDDKYVTEYEELNKELRQKQKQLAILNQERQAPNTTNKLNIMIGIENLNRQIAELEEARKSLDYRLKTTVKHKISQIIVINTFILPALILLLLWGIVGYIKRRNQKAARSLCHV